MSDLLTSLASGIVSVAGSSKGSLTELADPAGPLAAAFNSFRSENNADPSGKPKAFLNWILLDEQFQYVSGSSGAKAVNQPDVIDSLINGTISMEKNGYLYIYVSNETENWDVFFDNLVVKHRSGPLLEETHYYPFGGKLAGISSQALNFGGDENKRGFNGNELQSKEFSDGSGLEAYDFNARTYDQQIGRFHQQDPMAGKYFSSSPYNYVDGNPIVRNDPDGEDWFRNEKSGSIEWREISGKQGEQLSLKGSKDTWTNLGSELLVFNGENITYYTQSTNEDGKMILNSQSFDAVSGKPLESPTPSAPPPYGAFPEKVSVFTFDYSKERQGTPNAGPTPEGLYSINKSPYKEGSNEHGTQKWSDLSPLQKALATISRGNWGGGIGYTSWGDYRWRLNIESAETTRGRFFLHGGTKWGSLGCIDVGNNSAMLANAILTNKTGNDKVYIQVIYPQDLKIRVANGNTNQLQKIK